MFGESGRIELFGESMKTSAKFFGGHFLRTEVDVEECAFFPVGGFDETIGFFETFVKNGAWKGREDGNLYFVKFRIADKSVDLVKDRRILSIKSNNKAAVYGDAIILNGSNGLFICVKLSVFPVVVFF